MKHLRETYLFRLFRESKVLFVAVAAFIFLQFFFTFLQRENFPFFHYGMYSSVYQYRDTFDTYQITVSGRQLQGSLWRDHQTQIIWGSLGWFDRLKRNHFRDPVAMHLKNFTTRSHLPEASVSGILNDSASAARYPKWLLEYVADMRMITSPEITATRTIVAYQRDGNVKVINTDTIFHENE